MQGRDAFVEVTRSCGHADRLGGTCRGAPDPPEDVGPLPRTGLLVILALSPLLVLALVLTLRARTYAGKPVRED